MRLEEQLTYPGEIACAERRNGLADSFVLRDHMPNATGQGGRQPLVTSETVRQIPKLAYAELRGGLFALAPALEHNRRQHAGASNRSR